MDIYSIEKSGTIKSDHSAVGFYYDRCQIFHIGLLFIKSQNDQAKFLHLAPHRSLRTEYIEKGFWIRLGLTNRQIRQLAGFCALISENTPKDSVPFDIYYDANRMYFDDNGNYLHSEQYEGLTCATFIMAIFERLAFRLLLTENWKSDTEDAIWHRRIIETMRESAKEEAHFEAMANNIGCARYRPADIVIASSRKKGRPLPQKTVRRSYGALYKRVKKLSN